MAFSDATCMHVQLWALPEVRALTAAELEAHMREPEEDAEEAQADAAAADKAASNGAIEVSHPSY